jgi:hypothetical protein
LCSRYPKLQQQHKNPNGPKPTHKGKGSKHPQYQRRKQQKDGNVTGQYARLLPPIPDIPQQLFLQSFQTKSGSASVVFDLFFIHKFFFVFFCSMGGFFIVSTRQSHQLNGVVPNVVMVHRFMFFVLTGRRVLVGVIFVDCDAGVSRGHCVM